MSDKLWEHSQVKIYTNSGWKDWNPSDEFTNTYWFVESNLISLMIGSNKILKLPSHESGGIRTTVLGQDHHRLCTILYVLQENTTTGGVRYLVYGMDYNMHSDYGIGIGLSNVDKVVKLDRFLTDNSVVKYID